MYIAIAKTRLAKTWQNKKISWTDLCERCSTTHRTHETMSEYTSMSKDEQSALKDVGGFVGAYLDDGRRRKQSVRHRSLITLDLDAALLNVWDVFTDNYPNVDAFLYTTHSHTPDKPRVRIVVRPSRDMSVSEYEPIAREIARRVGIEQFDPTTYQVERLFYWPSTPKDGEFIFRQQKGKPLDVDAILAGFVDWTNHAEWSYADSEEMIPKRQIERLGDPKSKGGYIGAFCSVYNIHEAIDKYLPDVYSRVPRYRNRYTYSMGSTSGGMVVYNDVYAYSNHATDPTQGHCCNAFDLVRIHKFGYMDGAEKKDPTKMASFTAMIKLLDNDPKVKAHCVKNAISSRTSAEEDFADILNDADNEWMAQLATEKSGEIKNTSYNVQTILLNDPVLKGKVYKDLFRGDIVVKGDLPWVNDKTWRDSDDANLRIYLEKVYGISNRDKIRDAFDAVTTNLGKHPIKDYLNSLPEWDGKERLATLLHDYLGADDSKYVREVTKMHFVGAIARILQPGIKYDPCLVFAGPEGIGKSQFVQILGGEWTTDSIPTMEGKEGMEALRGVWFVELSELTTIYKSKDEKVKAFLSARSDDFRAAYGRQKEKHPRVCVFFGTTNDMHFLRGVNGNRRFMIVDTWGAKNNKYGSHWFRRLAQERDQIMAEALHLYRTGQQSLYLDEEIAQLSKIEAEKHHMDVEDPTGGMLEAYLEWRLPSCWPTLSIEERRNRWRQRSEGKDEYDNVRMDFCPLEYVSDVLGLDCQIDRHRAIVQTLNKYMRDNPDWEEVPTTNHVRGLFGRQRGYRRKKDVLEDDYEGL